MSSSTAVSGTRTYSLLERSRVGRLLVLLSLLISMPMKVNGAQQASAQGLRGVNDRSVFNAPGVYTYMPQAATRKVANLTDATKGANTMAAANMRCPHTQAVSNDGFPIAT